MIMIIGGQFQGKTDYAVKLGIKKNEIQNGASIPIDCPENIRCISDFQLFIKRVCDTGLDPVEKAAELLERNPGIVIISTEIGNGVIPIDKSDRLWREGVGKACCYLAARAERVIRMVCGIPAVIKESK